ncbi:hypothetical protein CHS0354_022728 [Potamilus streckersoni]|uniref:Uncharacterized protein n=1 Tax=Potamilus streckersoni TaxID=2493646 RepID=A0AAE0RT90_9BIVA|nr:hypothetical protein CHS0354_022728 [Potamilus streckersoni]
MLDESILAGRTGSATLKVSLNECRNADDSAFVNILLKHSPKPRISSQCTRKRKAESAMNLTSSPYKKMLIEKQRKTMTNTKRQMSKNCTGKWEQTEWNQSFKAERDAKEKEVDT